MQNKNAIQTVISRRNIIKMAVVGLFGAGAAPVLRVGEGLAAAVAPAQGKTLIVYYSRTGNTRTVVNHIQSIMQADVFELQTVDPYPTEYRATTEQAKKELESGYLPPLSAKLNNLNDYTTVIIGSPNWWGTVAMPVRTFLSGYDFSGKTVTVFITHGGSRLGRSMDDLKAFCPNSTILDGLAIRGGSVNSAKGDVESWLKNIGIVAG